MGHKQDNKAVIVTVALASVVMAVVAVLLVLLALWWRWWRRRWRRSSRQDLKLGRAATCVTFAVSATLSIKVSVAFVMISIFLTTILRWCCVARASVGVGVGGGVGVGAKVGVGGGQEAPQPE